MQTKAVARMTAAVVISVTAYVLCGVAGLWGVAFAAPALVLAPSAVKGAVVESRNKRALNSELKLILGGTRDER
jgi:hypothetical protein